MFKCCQIFRGRQNISFVKIHDFELRLTKDFDFQGCYTHKKTRIFMWDAIVLRKYMISEEINFLSLWKYFIYVKNRENYLFWQQ